MTTLTGSDLAGIATPRSHKKSTETKPTISSRTRHGFETDRGKIKYAWFCWEKGYKGKTVREFITFDTKTLKEGTAYVTERMPGKSDGKSLKKAKRLRVLSVIEDEPADYLAPKQLLFPYPGANGVWRRSVLSTWDILGIAVRWKWG